MSLRLFFSRRWLLATILVLGAMAVMARLGIWQLDRLAARRAFNARVFDQLDDDPLTLDAANLDLDLYNMEYRSVQVSGEYLNADSIVLRNQIREGEFGSQLGVELFTPLLITGSYQAILVERGWIPEDDAQGAGRQAYDVAGSLSVSGYLRRAETDFAVNLHPDPTLAPGESRLDIWNNLDLERIDAQTEVELLPVYLQRVAGGVETSPPYASRLEVDLSEGPHLGYAFQWFLFALILGVGYPFFVHRQEVDAEKE